MTDGDDRLSKRYRELPRDEPSARIDAAILASAQRAVAPPKATQRWAVPVSLAAVLVLALGVTLRMQREEPGIEVAVPQSEYPVTPAPAEPRAPAAPSTDAGRAVQDTVTWKAKEAEAPRRAEKKVVAPTTLAPAAPSTPVPPTPAAQPVPPPPAAQAVPPAAPPPARADTVQQAPAVSAAPRAEGAASDTSSARQATTSTLIKAAPAPAAAAPAPAPATTPAPTPSLRAQEASPQNAATPLQLREKREAVHADSMKRATVEPPPERELERIAALRREGRHVEADEALDKFRRDYPNYRIPDALWERVKPPQR